jgi:hypothetical protein
MAAAIMVAALSLVMVHDTAQRARTAAALAAWFAIVVTLAATGAVHDRQGIASAGVGLMVAVPIVLMSLALRIVPSLREGLDRAPLAVLAGVHVVRVLGICFLVLQASDRLPAPFALEAGWGDIVAGLAAVPVAWMLYRQARGWRAATIAWNLFGLADLVAAVSLGVLSSPGPLRRMFAEPGAGLMSTLPWLLIPGFLVPLLAITHLAIFYRLTRARAGGSPGPSDERSGGSGGFRLQS